LKFFFDSSSKIIIWGFYYATSWGESEAHFWWFKAFNEPLQRLNQNGDLSTKKNFNSSSKFLLALPTTKKARRILCLDSL
jgi:hypothetical protein